MTRTFIKVARKAEYDGGYTTLTEVAGGTPTGDGSQGPKGDKGDPGPPGEDGKDGVVDPSKLNMEFNVDQIDLKDADGNFCGLHVKGVNGITVTEDPIYGNQSMVISGSTGLEERILEGEQTQSEILQTIQDGLLKQQQIENQVEELSVTKGKVARYSVTEINNVPSASRPGQLVVNAANPSEVTLVSFGTEDLDNILTKPMANGDIMEFVDAEDGTVNRFTIIDGVGSPTLVAVEYVSGDNDFVVGEEEQIYIYPQNASGASKEYVDAQDLALQEHVNTQDKSLQENIDTVANKKLDKSGGVITGELHFDRGSGGGNMMIYPNIGTEDTSVYALNSSTLRFRSVSGVNQDSGDRKTHISISKDRESGDPITNIYHLAAPESATHAANKQYVDDAVAAAVTAAVTLLRTELGL